jgi:CIC family chloride channel protein
MKVSKLYHDMLLWRMKYISNRNFILLMSFVVGIGGGMAAVVMKTCVYYTRYLLTLGVPARYHNYLFFIYPLIGILLTVLIRLLFKFRPFGHGMSNLLLTISKKSSLIEPEKLYTHILSASITVGFGGSVGLEAPIVTTGAAIGSNLGRLFHLSYKKRTLLIGCGVAAGIGGIFNAPIAGLIFCIEVLLLELSVPAFIPLLIAAVTGTIVSRAIMGEGILFNFSHSDEFFNREIPFHILLGIFTGLISIYFLKTFNKVYDRVHKIPDSFVRAIWGGLALGLLIFIFPPLYGEGYENIKELLKGNYHDLFSESFFFHNMNFTWLLILFSGGIIATKVFASALTVGAGGNGGNFAPALFLGGVCGFFVSHGINALHILPFTLSETNFILVGMAGTMSGILHAPLTAVFLIAEITSGYNLILPLMLVSAISFFTSTYFVPHSIYISQLADKGHVHFHDKDRIVLTILNLKKMVETDFVPVAPEGNLRELVEAVSRSKRNIFPVVGPDEKLAGIVNLDDIRQFMFKPDLYDTLSIRQLMHPSPAIIGYTETMEEVMQKFDETGAWNLPVVDNNGTYIGLISKSKIFSSYRRMLKKQAREDTEIIE